MEQGDDFLGLAVRGFAGFGLNEAHHLGGLVAGAGLDFRKKPLPGLLGGQAGDFLQTVFLLIDASLSVSSSSASFRSFLERSFSTLRSSCSFSVAFSSFSSSRSPCS